MPTKIEWCDETWNPITGCTPLSEGCANCYAKRMASRFRGRYGYPPAPDFFRVTFHNDVLEKPYHWEKPRRIFVGSMGDIFHEHVQPFWVAMVLRVIRANPRHTFMMLTKRPRNAVEMLNQNSMFVVDPNKPEGWRFDCPPNLWMGVTVENQDVTHRISSILKVPSPVHFISVEPMLGPVDLVSAGLRPEWKPATGDPPMKPLEMNIDWVICGGETGPRARTVHPAWVRSLRDQCVSTGVPFFFKGWGRWIQKPSKAGQRMIDGREWNEVPR